MEIKPLLTKCCSGRYHSGQGPTAAEIFLYGSPIWTLSWVLTFRPILQQGKMSMQLPMGWTSRHFNDFARRMTAFLSCQLRATGTNTAIRKYRVNALFSKENTIWLLHTRHSDQLQFQCSYMTPKVHSHPTFDYPRSDYWQQLSRLKGAPRLKWSSTSSNLSQENSLGLSYINQPSLVMLHEPITKSRPEAFLGTLGCQLIRRGVLPESTISALLHHFFRLSTNSDASEIRLTD